MLFVSQPSPYLFSCAILPSQRVWIFALKHLEAPLMVICLFDSPSYVVASGLEVLGGFLHLNLPPVLTVGIILLPHNNAAKSLWRKTCNDGSWSPQFLVGAPVDVACNSSRTSSLNLCYFPLWFPGGHFIRCFVILSKDWEIGTWRHWTVWWNMALLLLCLTMLSSYAVWLTLSPDISFWPGGF